MKKLLFSLILLILAFRATADQGHIKCFNNPEVQIGINAIDVSEITFDRFNVLLDKVEKVYSPLFNSLGAILNIERAWTDANISAMAFRNRKTWSIKMFGGMARHPEMIEDGFLIIACHEVGHHLAGAPLMSSVFGNAWASNEGQSDYFSTYKCFKKVVENENHLEILGDLSLISESVKNECAKSYQNDNDIHICYRAGLGSLSAVRVQEARSSLPFLAQIEKRDPRIVSSTVNGHNSPQCRLDTLWSGSLCFLKDHCQDQHQLLQRPRCWYKSHNEK